jgi:hypothetical protein
MKYHELKSIMSDDQSNGGEWEIEPNLHYKNIKARKEKINIHVQDLILKELLKKRPDNPDGKNDLIVMFDNIMELIKDPDSRVKAMGIKLMTDLISKTESVIFHPAIAATIDIDNIGLTEYQKELFMTLMQRANKRLTG